VNVPVRLPVRWRPAAKLRGYAVIVGVGVVLALATTRPEPIVVVAPFALAIAVGLARTRALDLSVVRTIAQPTAVEGDVVTLRLELATVAGVPHLELAVDVPTGCTLDDELAHVLTVLAPGERRTVELPMTCERWGNRRLGGLALRCRTPLGFFVAVVELRGNLPLTVYPSPQTMRRLAEPLEPIAIAGAHVTRLRSSGSEFADLRPFAAGDRARDINWRASARRPSLWVDQRHPERSTDVVLLLDTFADAALPEAVRLVFALADAHLAQRDRVGLLRFGGTLGWVRAGSGLRQRYLVLRDLLGTSVYANVADRGVEQVPRSMLPPRALVIAVTPLLDDRMRELLFDLRARGIDLVVLEVAPDPTLTPPDDPAGATAFRLWLLEREAQRAAMREVGIPVVVHDGGRPLASTVQEVRSWPRHSRAVP
jgi:uncharacterized protein (DUF58 family)